MKHTIYTLTVLFMFLAVSVQAQTGSTADKRNATKTAAVAKGPVITFESNNVDFGTVPKDSETLREWKFTNTGDQPLIISNVRGSCGCTVPSYPTEPVMPGQSASIKVNYDTKRVGKFHKTITITSNASTPSLVVNVIGDILPEAAQEGNVPLRRSSSVLEGK